MTFKTEIELAIRSFKQMVHFPNVLKGRAIRRNTPLFLCG